MLLLNAVTGAPFPGEHSAVGALDALRIICASGGVEPKMAWRDHVALEAWDDHGVFDDMWSAAEREGAAVLESALIATRRALKLSLDAQLAPFKEAGKITGACGPFHAFF